ncbi:MAG: hypothetical protein V4567_14675 [Pseudomonadota bacterium]
MINRIGTALLLTSALITGCSMAHSDPNHPKKNPHPVQRYEVIATTNAPGPWDKVKGYISYEVVNPKCTPEDKFLGVHAMPADVGIEVEMTRIAEDTWKGYFYRDYLQDEDYYGLGVCHWDVTSVGSGFAVHGETFGAGDTLNILLSKGPQTEYFKISEYTNGTNGNARALESTAATPEVVRDPFAFFPITVAVKEVKP